MIKPIQKEKFPHSGFPYRLDHKEGKDVRVCWFQTEDHLNKHIKRYNLKKKDITVSTKP
jgi:hypothetical protein